MATDGILASAAASASYNMMLQLMFRLLTFVLNAFILRYVSRDLLGVVNVRLMLLYTTALFVSREAFRRACLSKSTDRRWPQVINLLWFTLPIGIACAASLGLVWIYVLEKPDPKFIRHYEVGVVMFMMSVVIELLAEPLWIVGQVLLFVRLRVIIEGIALALRCILTVVFIVYFPKWKLWAFCVAQVMHSVCYSSLYYTYFIYYLRSGDKDKEFPFKSLRDLFPKSVPGQSLVGPGLSSLTWSFFKQSALKQVLTEGERYIMTIFSVLSFAEQGIYDIINNLGSLAARFIFLPLEDASYLLFSHTLERGVLIQDQPKDNRELSSVALECLLKFVVLIGMTIFIFGLTYSELALDFYGGHVLSSGAGPTLLRWYSFYVLMLALNGVTEAFVFASMSKQAVDIYNRKMLVFSFIFLSSSWLLTHLLGSVGFIIANCLNMGARIIHSVYYIHLYYEETEERPLWGMLPYRPVILAYGASFLATFSSMRLFCCKLGWMPTLAHLVIGGLCFLITLAVIYFTEQPLINFFHQQYKKQRAKHKQSLQNITTPDQLESKKDH